MEIIETLELNNGIKLTLVRVTNDLRKAGDFAIYNSGVNEYAAMGTERFKAWAETMLAIMGGWPTWNM